VQAVIKHYPNVEQEKVLALKLHMQDG